MALGARPEGLKVCPHVPQSTNLAGVRATVQRVLPMRSITFSKSNARIFTWNVGTAIATGKYPLARIILPG
jgi:hypothetical protein